MLRRLIVVILMLGMAGTGAELVLLEHTEDIWQWTPLVLFAAGLPVAGWLLLAPGAASCSGLSDPDAGVRCCRLRSASGFTTGETSSSIARCIHPTPPSNSSGTLSAAPPRHSRRGR